MKKAFVFAGCACVTLALSLTKIQNKKSIDISLSQVEAVTACESIGWWDNDGNCVNNGRGVYFCKRDTWYEITDCKI